MAGVSWRHLHPFLTATFFTVALCAPYLENSFGKPRESTALEETIRSSQGLIGPLYKHTDLSLDLSSHDGCYYHFRHYEEGERIITNEPCLNCTCHNSMLMCYLKVCPFSKPIGQDCTIEKDPLNCCPVITCPQVPVNLQVIPLPTSTTTPSPSTAMIPFTEHGCTMDGNYYPDGALVPGDPRKPCELCYCIRNHTACIMQECILKVGGCDPVFEEGICCPVRYMCEHAKDVEEPVITTTTMVPVNESFITTTLLPLAGGCISNSEFYEDGAFIPSEDPCEHCYCMKSDMVCAVQECRSPLDEDNEHCMPRPPLPGKCCPEAYDCPEDDVTTIGIKDDIGDLRPRLRGHRLDDAEVPDVKTTIPPIEEETTVGTPQPEEIVVETTERESQEEITEKESVPQIGIVPTTEVPKPEEILKTTTEIATELEDIIRTTTETIAKPEPELERITEPPVVEEPTTILSEVTKPEEKFPDIISTVMDSRTTIPDDDIEATTTPISELTTTHKITSPHPLPIEGKPEIESDDIEEPIITTPETAAPEVTLEVETAAPELEDETEKVDTEAPELGTEAQKVETEAPEVETEAPGIETEAPEVETEAPEIETEVPEVGTEGPKVETEAPEIKTEIPEVETEAPKVELEAPEVETEATEVETESPEVETEAPEVKTESPEVETEGPKVGTESPEIKTEIPEVETEAPKVEIEVPEVETEATEVETKSPEVEAESPEVETEAPEVETESPELETESPEVETESPNIETESPEVETEAPKVETEAPEPETEVPEAETETSKVAIEVTPQATEEPLLKETTTKFEESAQPIEQEVSTEKGVPKPEESTSKEEIGISQEPISFTSESTIIDLTTQEVKVETPSSTDEKFEPEPTTTLEPDEPPIAPTPGPTDGIPGEGKCLSNGKTYSDGDAVPATSPCQEKCWCKHSIVSCQLIACPSPPPPFLRCDAQHFQDECCPTYECPIIEPDTVPSPNCIRNDKQYLEGEYVPSSDFCTDCYCLYGDIVCAYQECPEVDKKCKPISVPDGSCCPSKYECPKPESDSLVGVTSDEPPKPDDMKPTEPPAPSEMDIEEDEPELPIEVTPEKEVEIETAGPTEPVDKEKPTPPPQIEAPEEEAITTELPDSVIEQIDITTAVIEKETSKVEAATTEESEPEEEKEAVTMPTEEEADDLQTEKIEMTDSPATDSTTHAPPSESTEEQKIIIETSTSGQEKPEDLITDEPEIPDEVHSTESPEMDKEVTSESTAPPSESTEEQKIIIETSTSGQEKPEDLITDEPEIPDEVHATESPEMDKEVTTQQPKIMEVTTEKTEIVDEEVTTEKQESEEEEVTTAKQEIVEMPESVDEATTEGPEIIVGEVITEKPEVVEEEIATEKPHISEEQLTTEKQEPEIPDAFPTTERPKVIDEDKQDILEEATTLSPEYIEVTSITSEITTLPGDIPKGCTWLDNKFYMDQQPVPSDNECRENCRCNNGTIFCQTPGCPKPPPDYLNCKEIRDVNACCPTFDCPSIIPDPKPSPACIRNGTQYYEGDFIPSKDYCTDCYCLYQEIVCAVIDCPVVDKECVALALREDACCPSKYECPVHPVHPEKEPTIPPDLESEMQADIDEEEKEFAVETAKPVVDMTTDLPGVYDTTAKISIIDELEITTLPVIPESSIEFETTEISEETQTPPSVILEMLEDTTAEPELPATVFQPETTTPSIDSSPDTTKRMDEATKSTEEPTPTTKYVAIETETPSAVQLTTVTSEVTTPFEVIEEKPEYEQTTTEVDKEYTEIPEEFTTLTQEMEKETERSTQAVTSQTTTETTTSKAADKEETEVPLEISTEAVSEEAESTTGTTTTMTTEVPLYEGCWWFDNNVYEHGAHVPPDDECQANCRCQNGTVRCEYKSCLPAPPKFLQCSETSSNTSCCPIYDCAPLPTDLKCSYNGKIYENGQFVPSDTLCLDCYCTEGEVVCATLVCGVPRSECEPIQQIEDDCCPSTYECKESVPSGHMLSTETTSEIPEQTTSITTTHFATSKEPQTEVPEKVPPEEEPPKEVPEDDETVPEGPEKVPELPLSTQRPIQQTYVPPHVSVNETTTWTPLTTTEIVLGPGACLFNRKVYVSAQQIPRDDPCDFCFCFRGDIICLQQTCPPPISGCYEEAIPGFCCPRYECPVKQSVINVTTTTPYPTFPPMYKTSRETVCEIEGEYYAVGQIVKVAYSPCHQCICGAEGLMKCSPIECDSHRKVYKRRSR